MPVPYNAETGIRIKGKGMAVKVKKKNVIAIISVGIMVCLGACGKERPTASDITVDRERKGPTAILEDGAEWNADEDAKQNLVESMEEQEEKPEKAEEIEIAGTKKGIVFGSCEASGYQDFAYLSEALLSTSKTDTREKKTFSVYIPKENPRVSESSARCEEAGVYMKVDLEPYLQYKAESYSIRDNLEKYVTGEMDYYENYYDVIVGNVKEEEDAAVCEVTFMQYDLYEDTYAPYYVVYSLHDLGNNVTALVTLSIDAENTTEETRKLIDEISSFYQIDIHWDESFAQEKREKFEDKYTGNIYTVDTLTFKLPDGWEIDESMSDEFETYFAPGGDMEEAGGCFIVSEVTEAFGMVDMFLEDMDEMQMMLEEELTSELDTVTLKDMGITFLGRTFMVEMSIHDGYEDEIGNNVLYVAEDDNSLYMFYAFSAFEDEQETAGLSEEIQEAVTMFFDTGRVTDSFM